MLVQNSTIEDNSTTGTVARSRLEQADQNPPAGPAAQELQQINARLERIETALTQSA